MRRMTMSEAGKRFLDIVEAKMDDVKMFDDLKVNRIIELAKTIHDTEKKGLVIDPDSVETAVEEILA